MIRTGLGIVTSIGAMAIAPVVTTVVVSCVCYKLNSHIVENYLKDFNAAQTQGSKKWTDTQITVISTGAGIVGAVMPPTTPALLALTFAGPIKVFA